MNFDEVPFIAGKVTIQVSCKSLQIWTCVSQLFTSSIQSHASLGV